MLFDVFDNWRMDCSEKFLISAIGGGFTLLNVHDNAGRGIPVAVQFITVVVPPRTVWFLG